jgi:DNA-directed RNA polymerase subunit K/omega
MAKNNIRSFRYTDEVRDILEGFKGDSMNEKFENLVKYCFTQVPFVENRLAELEKEISEKYEKLRTVSRQAREIDMLIGNLQDIKLKIKNAGTCADIIAEKLL